MVIVANAGAPKRILANRRSVEQEVLDAVERLVTELGSRPGHVVTLDDALDRDLGLGSLERVELASRLERAFGLELGDGVLAEAATPRDLVSAMLAARPPRRAAPEVAVPLAAAPFAAVPAAPATARTLVDVLPRRSARRRSSAFTAASCAWASGPRR